MQTGKNISQKYPSRKKDTFNIEARLVTYDILNVCEIAVSTSLIFVLNEGNAGRRLFSRYLSL